MKLNRNEINKMVEAHNKGEKFPTESDTFIYSCNRYIKASRENRLMCSIDTVSKSGMSRTMKFFEMSKDKKTKDHYILNFYQLFCILGYTKVRDSDYFRISGCGMDMVFATHYNIIHELHGLGFITKKTRDTLAQKTPHNI